MSARVARSRGVIISSTVRPLHVHVEQICYPFPASFGRRNSSKTPARRHCFKAASQVCNGRTAPGDRDDLGTCLVAESKDGKPRVEPAAGKRRLDLRLDGGHEVHDIFSSTVRHPVVPGQFKERVLGGSTRLTRLASENSRRRRCFSKA